MSTRGATALLAGLVLAIGVVLGLVSHSIRGDAVFPTISCGSAWVPSDQAKTTDLGAAEAGVARDFESQCSSALTAPRILSFGLAGVGALVLLFVGLTATGSQRASVPAPPVPGERSGEQHRTDDGEDRADDPQDADSQQPTQHQQD